MEVYNDLIRPILDDRLNQMITYMKKHDIAYMDRNQDIFKIALVGGFGNYYLVKKQIEDKLGIEITIVPVQGEALFNAVCGIENKNYRRQIYEQESSGDSRKA